jgi:hypothetical protein
MFGERTHHMRLFQIFIFATDPRDNRSDRHPWRRPAQGARDLQSMTLADFFRTFEDHPGALPNFYPEAVKDVEDVTDFYHLTFPELREGQRKSPRLFKLPSLSQPGAAKR